MAPDKLLLQHAVGRKRFVRRKSSPTTCNTSKHGHRHDSVRKKVADEIRNVIRYLPLLLILGEIIVVTAQVTVSDRS